MIYAKPVFSDSSALISSHDRTHVWSTAVLLLTSMTYISLLYDTHIKLFHCEFKIYLEWKDRILMTLFSIYEFLQLLSYCGAIKL